MHTDGQWADLEHGDGFDLRLGSIITAKIRRRGGDSIYAKCWIATLNGRQVADTSDLEYAKGIVEWEIVKEMTNLSAAYRALKGRAPSSSDLYPDGAWGRWKAARKTG